MSLRGSCAPVHAADNGVLTSARPADAAFMTPRLQGELRFGGALSVGLWSAGDVLRLTWAPFRGPYAYRPNAIEGADGGVFAALSAPALLVSGRVAARVRPAPRRAGWDLEAVSVAVTGSQDRTCLELPWARAVIERRDNDLIIAVGANPEELERALALTPRQIRHEASSYADSCDLLPAADAALRSLVVQGVHAARSSVRRDARGGFMGLAAGVSYCAPARTYYRDGYWTLPLLLRLSPAVVRQQLDLLAEGVGSDGSAPSGVIVLRPGEAAAWEAFRASDPSQLRDHAAPSHWWSDHFDSPLLFILGLRAYVEATGDESLIDAHWAAVEAIFHRYERLAANGGLPLKPRNDRDWADNVYRSGVVAYDLGLWIGMADAVARFARQRNPDLAARAADAARRGRQGVVERLWLEARGWCADYAAGPGRTEPHLTLDSLTLLRFNALSDPLALRTLSNVEDFLETRRNGRQPWGDWGVMCAFPPFSRREDLRSKSAFPFRYHNGSDWPYLDGLYAEARLRRGLQGWRYPLTRWWTYGLEQGWTSPVEYFAPPWGRGSLLQAWSSFPAAVALEHQEVVLAGDGDDDLASASAKYSLSNRR